VCAVPLGRYEIRHGGDAQLKPPFNIISTLSFLFLAFVEPVRAVERGGVSIDSSAQTTAADSIISLVSFTHTVYIYTVVCFHCSDGKDGGGGEDSSILLR
jgi:hypothetical protein